MTTALQDLCQDLTSRESSIILETLLKLLMHKSVSSHLNRQVMKENSRDRSEEIEFKNAVFSNKIATAVEKLGTELRKSSLSELEAETEQKEDSNKRNFSSTEKQRIDAAATVCMSAISDCMAMSTKPFRENDMQVINDFLTLVRDMNLDACADVIYKKRIEPSLNLNLAA